MLSAPLRRDVGNGSLQNFQQGLLHSFARNVPSDGRIFAFTGNLINFVDIDNAALRFLYVKIGRLNQAQQNILNVLADVASLGQSGGIGNGKRNSQHLGEGLCQQCLAGASGTQQKDIALLQLHTPISARAENPFIMVIDGD